MSQICSNCRFFEYQPGWFNKVTMEKNLGVCKKRAPTLAVTPQGNHVTRWPRVETTGSCGDFKDRKTATSTGAHDPVPSSHHQIGSSKASSIRNPLDSWERAGIA